MLNRTIFLSALLFLPFILISQIPNTMSYQGMLTDNMGMVLDDGAYNLDISIYDEASGGNSLWSESHSVDIVKGVFSVILGSKETLDIPFDKAYWLEVSVDGEAMSPRTAITSSAYSLGGRATEVQAQSLAEFENGLVIKSQDTAIYFVPLADGMYIGPEADPNLKDHELELNKSKTPVTLNVKQLHAEISNRTSITGISESSSGIFGRSTTSAGIQGRSFRLWGVWGIGGGANGVGVRGESTMGIGVEGVGIETLGVKGWSFLGTGVFGETTAGVGVYGKSKSLDGVRGESESNTGVWGFTQSSSYAGVTGENDKGGPGVFGSASSGNGVSGKSDSSYGVFARSDNATGLYSTGKVAAAKLDGNVLIESNGELKIDKVDDSDSDHILVWGSNKFVEKRPISDLISEGTEFTGTLLGHDLIVKDDQGVTVFEVKTDGSSYHKGIETFDEDVVLKKGIKLVDDSGITTAGFGRTDLNSGERIGVYGKAITDMDLAGAFDGNVDIRGQLCVDDIKVDDLCVNNSLLVKNEDGDVILDIDPNADPISDYAIIFNGNLMINGGIEAFFKNFKIDHPLDPENKYLRHFSIESDELKNSYDGNVVLDKKGEAIVYLPDWFEALNRDFRYQLTCVGGFANVYISQEISGNYFKIAGGTEGLKVSWQVTGVRHDRQALEQDLPIEDYK